MNNSTPYTFLDHHKNCEFLVRECKALSIKEVVELYDISKSTVRRKYDEGIFPMFKVAGTVRGFRCWINVAIRNPQEIKRVFQKENPVTTVNRGSSYRERSLAHAPLHHSLLTSVRRIVFS